MTKYSMNVYAYLPSDIIIISLMCDAFPAGCRRVACASEDTFISVYALPAVPDGEVEKLYCSSVMPALLTGIQFGGDDNEYLVVSAYDHSELTVISNI